MSVTAAGIVFLMMVVGLFTLPFLPALRELVHRRDAQALRVHADGRVSSTYFAERFRQVLTERLAGPLHEVREGGQTLIGRIEDDEPFVVLPAARPVLRPEDDGSVDALVLAVGDLEIPDGTALLREVYAGGEIRGGEDVLARATLAEGHLRLGQRAISLRWMHGGGDVEIGADARLYGRVSADGRLHLATGTAFERLHAPVVDFGEGPDHPALDTQPQRVRVQPPELHRGQETSGGRTRVDGDLGIEDDRHFVGDLVVTGHLRLGANVRIDGSVKARSAHIGPGAEIGGALVASGELHVGEGARIHGPVLAEGLVALRTGCRVGSDGRLTTVRAERVEIQPGVRVHGTVWTVRDGGEVRA